MGLKEDEAISMPLESAVRLRTPLLLRPPLEEPLESTDLTLSGLKLMPGEPEPLPELLPELRAVSSLVTSPSRFFFS